MVILFLLKSMTGGTTHWVAVERQETDGSYPIVDNGHPDRHFLSKYGGKFWEYVVVVPK
ncbi:MAG: hypothetical protein WAO19_09645 [Candidatus Kryptoniota bacterium]